MRAIPEGLVQLVNATRSLRDARIAVGRELAIAEDEGSLYLMQELRDVLDILNDVDRDLRAGEQA